MTCHRPKVEGTKNDFFCHKNIISFSKTLRTVSKMHRCWCHCQMSHPDPSQDLSSLKNFENNPPINCHSYSFISLLFKFCQNCCHQLCLSQKIPSNLILFHFKTYKTETRFDLWILKKHWQEQSHIKKIPLLKTILFKEKLGYLTLCFQRKNSAAQRDQWV